MGYYRYQSLWDEGRGLLERWQDSLCCKALHCTLTVALFNRASIIYLKKQFLIFFRVIQSRKMYCALALIDLVMI